MNLRGMSVRAKLTLLLVAVSLGAMVATRVIFLSLDYVRARKSTLRQLSTLAEITAANCRVALASGNPDDQKGALLALAPEKSVVGACLYDLGGRIVSKYPQGAADGSYPAAPGPAGFGQEGVYFSGFERVVGAGGRPLGTLYMRQDFSPVLSAWFWESVKASWVVLLAILLAAYVVSRFVGRRLSGPILEIAAVAGAISEGRDSSPRVRDLGADEIGQLARAINQMLDRIDGQNEEIRESEGRLRTIVENLSEGLVVSDLKGQILHFNRAALDLHGFSTLDECRRHLSKFAELFELTTLEGETMPLARWPLARVLAGENLYNCEVRVKNLGRGSSRIFRYGGTLVRHAGGGAVMAVLTVEDITERKISEMASRQLNAELETRVSQRTAELEAANRELEAFSYSVSHDLRAPLRHIDGFSGLLSKRHAGALDEEGRRYLDTISGAARQMGRLIDDLLSFSRTGRSELRRSRVRHDALVAAVIRDGGFDKGGSAIEWRISRLPDVEADEAMLRQVWSNLIENAVKYSAKAQGPRIEIGTVEDPVGGGPAFCVRDNGVGFDMKYADKLFGVFQRLHSSAEFEGTGIGLANVRRIVARHGGRTWAEGAVGKGAAFFFTLPAAGPPGADRAGNQPEPFAGRA